VAAQEKPERFPRVTEDRLALEIELGSDETGREEGRLT
jgi:hypothetical protein